MLLLLIGILIFLFLLSFVIFDKDLLAPPTVVTIGLLFGAICTFYNETRWGLQFSGNTLLVIISAITAFAVGGVIVAGLANAGRKGGTHLTYKACPAEEIRIDSLKSFLIIAFELATIVLLLMDLRRVTGASSWFDIVGLYRKVKRTNPEMSELRISGLVKQCVSVSMYLALFYSYIVGNNLAARGKQKLSNWMPILLSTVMAFMQGYRSDMLRYWIAMLVVMYTVTKRAAGWKTKKETKTVVRKMAFSVIAIALIFVAVRGVVGRSSDKDPLYYLTFYAGCPIAALDSFVKNPIAPSPIWGKETFYTLNQNIGILFNKSDLRYVFFHEFTRSPNGTSIGNVYTGFRGPYYDFGFWGMILCMLIMGIFFTWFYTFVKKKRGRGPVDLSLLIYSYVAYTFFMYFYNCYNHFISFSIVKAAALFIVFKWFLFDVKIKRRVSIKLRRRRRPRVNVTAGS